YKVQLKSSLFEECPLTGLPQACPGPHGSPNHAVNLLPSPRLTDVLLPPPLLPHPIAPLASAGPPQSPLLQAQSLQPPPPLNLSPGLLIPFGLDGGGPDMLDGKLGREGGPRLQQRRQMSQFPFIMFGLDLQLRKPASQEASLRPNSQVIQGEDPQDAGCGLLLVTLTPERNGIKPGG
ncbi:hypothetical protein CB1_001249008, partial [Camelus ferus]